MTHTASPHAPRTALGTAFGIAAEDLTARGAVAVAAGAMIAVSVLDVLNGRIEFAFSLGFVLVVLTIAIAVDKAHLFTAGVLPPVLLLVSLATLCVLASDSVAVDGVSREAGLMTRYIAAVVDHGLTLVVGHGLALAAIVWRILRDI